jgi:hypothetical protein
MAKKAVPAEHPTGSQLSRRGVEGCKYKLFTTRNDEVRVALSTTAWLVRILPGMEPVLFQVSVVGRGEDGTISIALAATDDGERTIVLKGSVDAASNLVLAIVDELAAIDPAALSPLRRLLRRLRRQASRDSRSQP